MGTKFHTILYAHSEAQAKEALDTVATRLNALNASLSDYVTSSEVSRLSASSGRSHWKLLHPDLEAVLSFGQRLSQQTDGAFDMTVGPLTRLWRHSRRHNKLPTKNRLRQALDATGHSNLILDSRNKRARLKRPSMRLDLGGIAKGYAVDEALATLKQLGITIALVNGGGDLRAAGIHQVVMAGALLLKNLILAKRQDHALSQTLLSRPQETSISHSRSVTASLAISSIHALV